MSDDVEIVTVHLVGVPLDVHARSTEHTDELMREFTYLHSQADDPDAAEVPARLVRLIDELNARFGGFTAGTQSELDDAAARGDKSVDLTYRVPPDVKDACIRLDELLDEADRYCERGEHLLTLASSPEAVAYRKWFLSEFVAQTEGAAPRPWQPQS
jgi:hypothetical protein